MKLKTTRIISGDGAVVVKPQPQYAVRGIMGAAKQTARRGEDSIKIFVSPP